MAVSNIPFVVKESIALTEGVISLFDRSFHASPPEFPRHFVALEAVQPSEVAAYVHFTAAEGGVFLLGGLCVDERCYRRLDHQQRRAIAAEGSLSRWLLRRSIELLKQLGRTLAIPATYAAAATSRRSALSSLLNPISSCSGMMNRCKIAMGLSVGLPVWGRFSNCSIDAN